MTFYDHKKNKYIYFTQLAFMEMTYIYSTNHIRKKMKFCYEFYMITWVDECHLNKSILSKINIYIFSYDGKILSQIFNLILFFNFWIKYGSE